MSKALEFHSSANEAAEGLLKEERAKDETKQMDVDKQFRGFLSEKSLRDAHSKSEEKSTSFGQLHTKTLTTNASGAVVSV